MSSALDLSTPPAIRLVFNDQPVAQLLVVLFSMIVLDEFMELTGSELRPVV